MLARVILFCFVIKSCYSSAIDGWTGLRVRWANVSSSEYDVSCFFKIPNTVSEGLSNDWFKVNVDTKYNLTVLAKGTTTDYGVNGMYDANGILAGLEICQPATTLRASVPAGYNILDGGTFEEKTVGGQDSLCTSFLIVSPKTLKAGGRKSLKPFGEGVWLRNTSNKDTYYTEYPTNVTQLLSTTNYHFMNCIPEMGSHYFYSKATATNCNLQYNWFILGKNSLQTVHGLGIVMYGKYSNRHVYNTDWWEYTNSTLLRTYNHITNECYLKTVDTWGQMLMHIYFVDKPWEITCADTD